MTNLVELDLGDGRSILIASNDEVTMPRGTVPTLPFKRTSREASMKARFELLADSLRGFTDNAVAAFRDGSPDIERVTLQFGVSLAGEAGLPYITENRNAGALLVTVECRLGGLRPTAGE